MSDIDDSTIYHLMNDEKDPMEDYMETEGGMVSLPDGWWLESSTGNRISPDGTIYDEEMNVIGKSFFAEDEE